MRVLDAAYGDRKLHSINYLVLMPP